jgi:cytochrome P450
MPANPNKVFSQPDANLLSRAVIRNSSDLLRLLISCHKHHGDYVLIDGVPGLSMYLLTDPAAVQHVLVTGQENYVKPPAYAVEMAPLMGSGLLTSEGPDWLKQRRISQPIFNANQMPGLLHVVSSCTTNLLTGWQSVARDEWIDFYKEMLHLTNTIAVELLFGSDSEGEGQNLKAELADTLFRLKMHGADTHQQNSQSSATHLVDRFHNLIVKLIARRRQSLPTGDDLLSYYIAATEDSSAIDFGEQELLDEVKTLTIGGHHNVAAALSWCVYLLAVNDGAQRKLDDELMATASSQRSSIAELGKLEYLRAVLQESMRLYPPVWGTTREAVGEDSLNGYEIPSGSMVFLCQWITHRHPQFWEKPDSFDPDRFSGARAAYVNKFAYFPFGRGQRHCIAEDLSFMSMILIASELMRKYQFSLPAGWTAEIDPTYVLAPKGGLPVRLQPRA